MAGRERARYRWLTLGVLVAGLSLVATSVAVATGPVGTDAGFEDDDGNQTPAAPISFDWNSFDPITWAPHPATTPTRQADKVLTGWTFKGLEDWQATTSDSSFAGGTKQSDDCAVIGTGKADNKADLKRVYVASKTGTDGHVYLMLGWVRIAQNTTSPSAHVAFEFNQNDAACPAGSPPKNHGGLHPRSTANGGDLLVLYDFEGGSDAPIISISRWTASGWTAPDALSSGEAEAKVNTESATSDDLATPLLSSTTGESVTESLGIKEFGEAGIDLTDANVFPATATDCLSFGSVFGVTRTSGNSDTAQMKDIVGPGDINITNCGKVIIRKVTSPAGDTTTNFTYSTNVQTLPGPSNVADFDLKDGGRNTIDDVKPASSRTVTESNPGPAYLLTNIDCAVAAHPSTVPAANISTNTTTRVVTFSIAAGQTLDCTFTNTKQKQESAMDTAPWIYPNDKATVTPTDATGTVKFRLFGATTVPLKTAAENCAADDGTNTANGLIYRETVTLPGAAPLTVNTSNPGTTGSPNSVKISSSATVYWRVSYSGDSNYFGRLSGCNENIVVTLATDTGGTNVPDAQ